MTVLESVASAWWATMVSLSTQFILLTAVALCLHWLLRNRDPRLRYAMWVLVLGRLLVPFDLSTPLGLGTAESLIAWTSSDGRATSFAERSAEVPGRSSANTAASPGALPSIGPEDPAPLRLDSGRGAHSLVSLRIAAFGLWWCGFGFFACVVLASVRRAQRLVRDALLSDDLTTTVRGLAVEIGTAPAPVHVAAKGSLTGGPVVTGLLHPTIVVPAEAVSNWPAQDLRAALVHELAHIKRGDLWVLALQQVVLCLFFFHPLVWLVSRFVLSERELCCDDAVMRQLRGGREKDYLHALLHSAGAPGRRVAASLGVTDGANSLESRIRRITNSTYQSGTVRKFAGVSAVAMVVLASAAFVGGSTRTGGDDTVSSRMRLEAVRTVATYSPPGQDGQIDWQNAEVFNGDVVLGGLVSGQSLRTINLGEAEEGRIQVRLRVGTDGAPSSVDVMTGQDSAAVPALLPAIRTHRFEPTMHKAFGAVGVEMMYNLAIVPKLRSFEAFRPTLGEVAEVVGALDQDDSRLSPALLAEVPAHLAVIDKPDFQGAVDQALEGDLSFGVILNRLGEVEAVERLGAAKTLMGEGGQALNQLTEQLTPWIERLQFQSYTIEPPATKVLTSLDLRIQNGKPTIVTYAPPGDEWRDQLASAYSLGEGDSVKFVPAPFGPARLDLFRSLDPSAARRHTNGPAGMILAWTEAGLGGRVRGNCYGSCWLLTIDRRRRQAGMSSMEEGTALGYLRDHSGLVVEVALGPETESAVIGGGDMIVRDGASDEELLDGFAAEVESILNVPVLWEQRVAQRPTIVLRGSMGVLAKEPALGNAPVLHIFNDEKDPDPRSGAGFSGAADGPSLASALKRFLGIQVIDETVGDFPEQFTVRLHRSASGTQFLQNVLENIEQQAGLDVSLEQRPTEVVKITIGR